jgi:hypothetical protein
VPKPTAMKLLSGDIASALGSTCSLTKCAVDSSRSPLQWRTRSIRCCKSEPNISSLPYIENHTRLWVIKAQIQSFPSATWRILTALASFEAGSMSVRSSKRLPRDSTSIRTNAWLSFFHRMRFFPEREKQNERYLGKVPPELPDDAID